MLLKNKVQWLDLTSHFWPPLVGLPLAKKVWVHYEFMVKYFKLCLSSSLKDYSWFFQYMYNDNANVCNTQPFLVMQSKSFHFIFIFIFLHLWLFIYIIVICFNMLLYFGFDFCV
jgi:hypothetical protein